MTETTLTAREELYELAEILRAADEAEKEAKDAKAEVRGPFFELISEVVRDEIPLARKNITVTMDEDFDPEDWRKREFPEWRIAAIQPNADGTAVITVEENEEFKKFEFVHDGFKFGRTIRREGAGFDAEGFYDEVSRAAAELGDSGDTDDLLSCIKVKTVTVYELDEAKATQIMADQPETVVIFQKYTNPGTPKVALLPIKAIKE